jgi:hypothetical protein
LVKLGYNAIQRTASPKLKPRPRFTALLEPELELPAEEGAGLVEDSGVEIPDDVNKVVGADVPVLSALVADINGGVVETGLPDSGGTDWDTGKDPEADDRTGDDTERRDGVELGTEPEGLGEGLPTGLEGLLDALVVPAKIHVSASHENLDVW